MRGLTHAEAWTAVYECNSWPIKKERWHQLPISQLCGSRTV